MGARSAARISVRTLPRYLAPSLMTARTSAMPLGRFSSRHDAPIGSPASGSFAARVLPSHR
jgi:hypothetical protein